MWESLARVVGDNPVFTLVITIFGTTTIWLYKEFKEMIDQRTKTKTSTLNEKIKLYGKLQANIVALIQQSENIQLRLDFIEKFGEYIVFLSEDARRIWLDYIRHDDPSYLVSLLAFISMDLKKLDKEKMRLSADGSSTDLEEIISKLFAPFKPIFIIWIMVWGGSSLFVIYKEQYTWYGKFSIIAFSLSLLASIIVVYSLFSLMLQKQLSQQGKYRWFLNICLIAAPLLSVTYKGLSIVSLMIQIVSLMLLIKRKRSEKNFIIEI